MPFVGATTDEEDEDAAAGTVGGEESESEGPVPDRDGEELEGSAARGGDTGVPRQVRCGHCSGLFTVVVGPGLTCRLYVAPCSGVQPGCSSIGWTLFEPQSTARSLHTSMQTSAVRLQHPHVGPLLGCAAVHIVTAMAWPQILLHDGGLKAPCTLLTQ